MTFARRRQRALAVTLCLTVVVAACRGGDDVAVTTDDATSSSVPATTTTSADGDSTTTTAPRTSSTTAASSTTTTTTLPAIPRQPLTGEPLADGEEPIDRPALAVKIDNAPGARRNHSGLAVADIVFEEIVEGSITRFAAVFHSQGSSTVGPIRSGRSQDIDLLTSFRHPLFAWSGGNAGVTRLIAESPFVDLNAVRGGKGYYRGPGTKPHDLYNDTDSLWAQTPADHPGAPPQQFEYLRPGAEFSGVPTAGFDLSLRGIDVEWRWDAESGRFLRSQEGRAHVDALHGRIGATNVIVMGVWYRPSAIDARSPEAQTLSESAPLWVFSDGELVIGRWSRDSADDTFTFEDVRGRPILLEPGITWVELAEGITTDDQANPFVDITVLPPD